MRSFSSTNSPCAVWSSGEAAGIWGEPLAPRRGVVIDGLLELPVVPGVTERWQLTGDRGGAAAGTATNEGRGIAGGAAAAVPTPLRAEPMSTSALSEPTKASAATCCLSQGGSRDTGDCSWSSSTLWTTLVPLVHSGWHSPAIWPNTMALELAGGDEGGNDRFGSTPTPGHVWSGRPIAARGGTPAASARDMTTGAASGADFAGDRKPSPPSWSASNAGVEFSQVNGGGGADAVGGVSGVAASAATIPMASGVCKADAEHGEVPMATDAVAGVAVTTGCGVFDAAAEVGVAVEPTETGLLLQGAADTASVGGATHKLRFVTGIPATLTRMGVLALPASLATVASARVSRAGLAGPTAPAGAAVPQSSPSTATMVSFAMEEWPSVHLCDEAGAKLAAAKSERTEETLVSSGSAASSCLTRLMSASNSFSLSAQTAAPASSLPPHLRMRALRFFCSMSPTSCNRSARSKQWAWAVDRASAWSSPSASANNSLFGPTSASALPSASTRVDPLTGCALVGASDTSGPSASFGDNSGPAASSDAANNAVADGTSSLPASSKAGATNTSVSSAGGTASGSRAPDTSLAESVGRAAYSRCGGDGTVSAIVPGLDCGTGAVA